jgi:hypothetical protein
VSQLTVGDVERWIAWMRATGAGDPTILKACTVLQALLSMAVRDGIVTVNVASRPASPARPARASRTSSSPTRSR